MPWSILTRARTSFGGNRPAAPDLTPRGPERRHTRNVGWIEGFWPIPVVQQTVTKDSVGLPPCLPSSERKED